MSTKEKAIKDLLYISEKSNIDNFMKRGKVFQEAERLNLTDLIDYVGVNSKKYLDLLIEDWQKYC